MDIADDQVTDQQLVALSASEMAPVQTALTAWCDRKCAALDHERQDIETNLELATEHGWKHASVASALSRVGRRIQYYQKMKTAIEAGYVIVPNFPVDLFAVRVNRAKQPEKVHDSRWSNFRATPQQLPTGEGRYVDDRVTYRDESTTEALPDGKTKTHQRYGEYDEVDFPVAMVKPAVMEATARAMALKVFDQMGIVHNAAPGRDPIVVGQLLDPRGNGRVTTFFVAWWLDTAAL